jgi:hypothetical protein
VHRKRQRWVDQNLPVFVLFPNTRQGLSRASSSTRGASDFRLQLAHLRSGYLILFLLFPLPLSFLGLGHSMPPPPGSSSQQSRRNPSATPSPTDNNDNPPSSSRLSKDSEGYPSWLPKRPPPPAPASTFQSSMLGDLHGSSSPSPVEPAPIIGGRKPTPRSVRIVNLQDSFVGAVEKEARFAREPTDQTQAGVHPPPKVWTRSSGVPPAAFNASAHDDVLPLPQPRFKAKNLQLQILDNPSKWMRLYFYAWPLLVLYHIPLQTFFDFNAVFILLQYVSVKFCFLLFFLLQANGSLTFCLSKL